MGKNSKARATKAYEKKQSNKLFWLIAIPLTALVIKLIVMANTQGGGWLGADGENYLTGVDGLLKDGFFSKEGKLLYWPAGYPIFVWPLAAISISKFVYFLGLIQSTLFAYATFLFTRELKKTNISFLAVTISLLITFNPTLSLSTLAVGYEAPVAALLMISMAYLIRDLSAQSDKISLKNIIIIALSLSVSSFLQPRILLFGVAFIFFWCLKKTGSKARVQLLGLTLVLVMLFPSVLILRNIVANDKATISTNLGVTMRIGAGDDATGGYGVPKTPIPCPPKSKGQEVTDNQIVGCVLKWYLSNPGKAAQLMINKTVYYWSPWFGPSANGTMARNPWLKVSPLVGMAKSESGNDLIYGGLGRFISWVWLLGGLLLVGAGLIWLWRLGGIERSMAWLAGIPVILGWLTSLGTIGDHRFRIPQMGLSLFLQVVGVYGLRRRLKPPA
jgi:hypothetical protein